MKPDDANAIHRRDGADALRSAFDRAVTKPALDERAPPPNGEGDYGFGAPPAGDDRPKPRFRTLRQFCAEYEPLAFSFPVRSTR